MAREFRLQAVISARDNASRVLGRVGHEVETLQERARALSRQFESTGRKLTVGLTLPLTGLGLASLKAAGDFEQQQIALETMLGSAKDAQRLLSDLVEFARTTPFELKGLLKSTKQLLAYGSTQETVLQELKALGNIAAGVGQEKLPQLILAYGQVRAATKLTGNELRQFTEAGVPLLQELAKQSGRSISDIADAISEGEVSFEDVRQALFSMTRDGGKFFNLMQRQSSSFQGQLSNLGDSIDILRRDLGEALLPVAKDFIQFTDKRVIPVLETWIKNFKSLDTQTQKVIIAAGGLTAALGPLLVGLGLVLSPLVKSIEVLAQVARALALLSVRLVQATLAASKLALELTVRLVVALVRLAVTLLTQTIPSLLKFALVTTINALRAIGNFEIALVTRVIPALIRFAITLTVRAVGALILFSVILVTRVIPALGGLVVAILTQGIPALLKFSVALVTDVIPALLRLIVVMAVQGVRAVAAFAISLLTSGIPALGSFAVALATDVIPALISLAATITTTTIPAIAALVAANLPLILGIGTVVAAVILLKKAWDNNLGGIQERAQGLADFIVSWKDRIWAVLMTVRDAVKPVIGAFGALAQAIRSLPKPQISLPNITGTLRSILPFQQGGLVTRPTVGLVAEAGPELVIPLEKLEGLGGTVNINIQGLVPLTPGQRRQVAEIILSELRNIAISSNRSADELLRGTL